MAGYSGTPLPTKLGVKPGSRVVILGAPAGFALEPLPDGVIVRSRLAPSRTPATTQAADVVLFFVTRLAKLEGRYDALAVAVRPAGALWIAWPKRASGVETDLTENVVRDLALAKGMVDTKVCAVDDTWSGLKLVYRLKDR